MVTSYCHGITKFLDDNKPKIYLTMRIRTVLNFIDLIQFHLISQKVEKFSGVESERTVYKLRKRKQKLYEFLVIQLLHEAGE